MSDSLQKLIWRSPFKGDRKLLLLGLAQYANETNVAWPGVPLLARDTGFTIRGVEKMLAYFVSEGVLQVVERGNGRGNTTKYRFLEAGLRKQNPERQTVNTEANPEQGPGFQVENPEPETVYVETNPEPDSVNTLNPEQETPNAGRGLDENPERELSINPERDACAYKEEPLKELKKYISGTNVPGADAPTHLSGQHEEPKTSVRKPSDKKNTQPKSPYHKHPSVVAYRDILGFKALNAVQAELIAGATGPDAESAPPEWLKFLCELAETGNKHAHNVRVMVWAYEQHKTGACLAKALDLAWRREKDAPSTNGNSHAVAKMPKWRKTILGLG
jgi:hypothetical protein